MDTESRIAEAHSNRAIKLSKQVEPFQVPATRYRADSANARAFAFAACCRSCFLFGEPADSASS